jgi:flagellar biogenesis protein FliO
MYHWMDASGWFLMSLMMIFWIILLGAVVYVAVRLANGNRHREDPQSR